MLDVLNTMREMKRMCSSYEMTVVEKSRTKEISKNRTRRFSLSLSCFSNKGIFVNKEISFALLLM